DLALPHAETRSVAMRPDFLMGEPRGIGGLLGNDSDLLERRAGRAGDDERDVVDVAGGPVR
ncbi:MAG: hypothetical protein RL077_3748, partial [Verrucomicrobiota bacterium]